MATIVSNLELIRRIPLFSMLTPSQAALVASAVVKRRFKRGEVIVEKGKTSNVLIILLTGKARVVNSDARGREVILATMNPGDYVGEMSLIDDEPHSATVLTEMQTDVLVLSGPEFERCLPKRDSMAYAILRGLVQRLRYADRKIESLALLDVYGRVAMALLESAAESLPCEQGHGVIVGRLSRQDIAKRVGASREMVSRVMKDLEERGFIETREDGALRVKDELRSLC